MPEMDSEIIKIINRKIAEMDEDELRNSFAHFMFGYCPKGVLAYFNLGDFFNATIE